MVLGVCLRISCYLPTIGCVKMLNSRVLLVHLLLALSVLQGARADGTGEGCDDILPAATVDELDQMLQENAVVVMGMPQMRCTVSAHSVLHSHRVCFHRREWDDLEDPLYRYLKCKHPNEFEGGVMMHSYVYIGGQFVGNGFKIAPDRMPESRLLSLLRQSGADTNCTPKADCAGIVSAARAEELDRTLKSSSVVLYGWNGCPCTDIARRRFEGTGVCYAQNVWSDSKDPLMRYLQCLHGAEHHSFVYVGGEFFGNGFQLAKDKLSEKRLVGMLEGAGSRFMCQREGDKNLQGKQLDSCTQANDGTTTGWTRSGSCNWDPSDSGYHEVCVTMSDDFLEKSARHDANDLRSVVSAGGHWCICAWAFAAAVRRDPENLEGIHLDCERTNGKLREVYEQHVHEGRMLHSPSGIGYEAQAALDKVNEICGGSKGLTGSTSSSNQYDSVDKHTLSSPSPARIRGMQYRNHRAYSSD